MEIKLTDHQGVAIAKIVSDDVLLNNGQDSVELIGNCGYNGSERIMVHAHHLHPDFFELKNGIAGEILQKFSTYRAKLAVVGNFSGVESKSLRDFIFESNKTGRIGFVASEAEAMDFLSR